MVVKTQATLKEVIDLSSSVKHFIFEADEDVEFNAGQFVNVIHEDENGPIRRAYSLANTFNTNKTKQLEFCIKLVENGQLTPKLFEMKPGTKIQIMAPLGLFKLRGIEEYKNQVFIAAGTGVAPMRSFILDLLKNKQYNKPILLLLGIRYENEILYHQEFTKLSQRFSNFSFIPVISKPTSNWPGKKGYVQNHTTSELIEFQNSEFYICGLNAMVDAVVEVLNINNVAKENIKFEKYG